MPRFEDGRYRMRVISQGFGERDNGTPFFYLECEPLAQLKGSEAYEPLDKYPRTIQLAITEKSKKYVADKLLAIGWPGGEWPNLDPSVNGFHSFVDQEIEAVCENKPSQHGDGKIYENWDVPFGSREAIASDPAISRKLQGMFGMAAPKAAKPAAKPQPRKQLPAKATVPATSGNGAAADSGDDVPF